MYKIYKTTNLNAPEFGWKYAVIGSMQKSVGPVLFGDVIFFNEKGENLYWMPTLTETAFYEYYEIIDIVDTIQELKEKYWK